MRTDPAVRAAYLGDEDTIAESADVVPAPAVVSTSESAASAGSLPE